MARKTKSKKVKEQKAVGLRVCDFAFPGEKSSYLTGIVGVAIVFIWLAAMGFFFIKNAAGQRLWYVPLEIMAYPVLAVLIGNMLATKPRAALMKKAGRQSKVMSNNFADLYRVLSRQASLLGMKNPPDMYLVNDPQPLIYSLPAGSRGTIIASQALRDALSEEEFEAVLAHEVAHNVCGHVRMEVAMVFIRNTNIGLKLVLFPVLLMMLFARAWMELIEFTADRGALLVMLRPAIVNAAIVKFAVVADPNAGISREELQAYIDTAGDISTDAKQIERHFKVGQFMNTQPGLRDRIEQLSEFPSTTQGKEALAKMAEVQGVTVNNIPQRRSAADELEHVLEEEADAQNM